MEKILSQFNNKYSVSDTGIVYSLKGKKKELKGKIKESGYREILINHLGNRSYILVHRLVLEAFKDNPENKDTVNHIDGNKLNNSLSNLEWATYQENQIHARNTGLCKSNKINMTIARMIRADKGSHRNLAEKYGLKKTQIGYIKKNKRWIEE
jgi:hypothetical protein